MSGHSKWATTKRQKAVMDAKRGAIFTRVANMITVAAREKGGDINANFALRMAVEKAKGFNIPKENIGRAIKRGTGELSEAQIEELIYEGFGPAKSQFIVKSLTDNKNRGAAAIRHLFSEHSGSLGSVLWNFSPKGVIRITAEELASRNLWTMAMENPNINAEEFELELIDAGAENLEKEDEGMTINTKIEDLQKVKNFLDSKNIKTESAEIEYVAKVKQEATGEDREKIEKFIEALEDSEDVSDYYTNVNI